MFKKGKTFIIAKIHGTDLVICSHSREGKILSYSQITTVTQPFSFIPPQYVTKERFAPFSAVKQTGSDRSCLLFKNRQAGPRSAIGRAPGS